MPATILAKALLDLDDLDPDGDLSQEPTGPDPDYDRLVQQSIAQSRKLIARAQRRPSPASPSPAPPLDPAPLARRPPERSERAEAVGRDLHQTSAGAYLYGTATAILGRDIDPAAYQHYLAQVLSGAGDPEDPLERILIEQIVLAHHAFGGLLVRAGTAEDLDQTVAYSTAAARMAAEARRSTLALQAYRTPAGPKQIQLSVQPPPFDKKQIA